MPGGSHSAQFMKVDGRKYVVVMNEGTGCRAPWTHIVDVNDEANPAVISTFRLEVNKPENCDRTRPDHDGLTLGDPGGIYGILMQYRYGSHYLGVDNVEDAKVVAFTWYSAGLRLVDVRDPYNPKEVGYFITPAIDTGEDRAVPDCAYSFVRFHKGNIWFTSVNEGSGSSATRASRFADELVVPNRWSTPRSGRPCEGNARRASGQPRRTPVPRQNS